MCAEIDKYQVTCAMLFLMLKISVLLQFTVQFLLFVWEHAFVGELI